MMGIGFVIFLSRILVNIEHAKFLVRYGENTIVVMAYHYFIIECYCSLFFEIKKYFVAYKFLEFILVLLLIDLLVRYSTYIGIPSGMKNKIMKLS